MPDTVLAVALVLLAGSVLWVGTSLTRTLRADLEPIDAPVKPLEAAPAETTSLERLAACERKLESLYALRAEWTAYQEIIEDALETVETKRRRAAASASSRSNKQPAEVAAAIEAAGLTPQPPSLSSITDRAELRRRALAAGKI